MSSTRPFNGSIRLSENFTMREAVRSQTAARLGIDNRPPVNAIPNLALVAGHILQPCRAFFGVPFVPSSWYRSPALCEAIGSRATSQHAVGQAVDFEISGVANLELAEWIVDNLDFDQLILEYWRADDAEAGWVHCSYVGPGQNRKQVLRFDGKTYTPGLE